MNKIEAQTKSWRGSYRAHKAAVMAAMRHYMPDAKRVGVDKTWYRCPSVEGLDVVLDYIRENTPTGRTAAQVRDLLHEIGAPAVRGLPKAKRAAAAVRVKADGSEDVVVATIGLLPYARCVWRNLMPVAVDVRTLEITHPPEGGANLYVTGVPPVVEADDEQDAVARLVVDEGAWVGARHVNRATREIMPRMEIIGLDTEYICVDEAAFRAALAADMTDQLEYIPNVRDCDNFAEFVRVNLAKAGLSSVGVVWDYSSTDPEGKPAPHAYNVVALLPDNNDPVSDHNLPRILAIEPQTDAFVQLGKGLFTAAKGKVLW